MPVELKAAVTVAEMARMCGLSRARFYQLIGTAFPFPVYDVSTRRPFYVEELQKLCLEVRRRNCGIDGKPVLFYARRGATTTAKRPMKLTKVKSVASTVSAELLDGLRALGLIVTSAQVEAAIKEVFPSGTHGVVSSEVVRSVFIYLKKAA